MAGVGRWTLKGIVQGTAFGHPTHPMLVHFPTALYPGALALDVLSRITGDAAYTKAATLLIGIGVAFAVGAAGTGLVDWAGMVPGSTKRRRATVHMLVQAAAQAVAVGAFFAHYASRDEVATVAAIVLVSAAIGVMIAGNWLGGLLVYRYGMRVSGPGS